MTEPRTTTLIRATASDISADALITLCARHKETLPAIGFAYTSATAAFFDVLRERNRRPVLYSPSIEKKFVDLEHVFELRLFNEHADLHWVRRGASGRLTAQVEPQQGTSSRRYWFGQDRRQIAILRPFAQLKSLAFEPSTVEWHDHNYLIWGEGLPSGESKDGWGTTSCARIGPLQVPLALTQGQRAVIRAREYFAKMKQGNVCFVGERLLGLGVLRSVS